MKRITAKYPSNIALVKYWGKYGKQLPCNASLSLTLSEACTTVEMELSDKKEKELEFTYLFEGKNNEKFNQRIIKYLQEQPVFADVLNNFAIKINASNSFPHSAGIASSASAFATVAAAFLTASDAVNPSEFKQKASNLARLGSGSAARSFDGPFTLWGKLDGIQNSSNEHAVPITNVHTNFQKMHDAILIVEDTPKKVSSSVGHALMNNHPFANARFQQANQNAKEMISIIKSGDYDNFIALTEREALTLHAMMMTSTDYYILMKPNTIKVIEKVMEFRNETKLPLCFTLDAGPNIHLLYPDSIAQKVRSFIKSDLQNEIKSIIFDRAGTGGNIFIH